MSGQVLRTLQAIDWDFALPRSGYVAPPHWYPGTFVPALSDALIETLTPSGGTVFDPYGGIGTTGWSAIRAGRSCHIADVNPVAILSSYATTSLLTLRRADPEAATAALAALGQAIGRKEDLFGTTSAGGSAKLDQTIAALASPAPEQLTKSILAGPPRWDLLKPWIAAETITELSLLMDCIAKSDSHYVRLIGLCMASATARSVSSQHASWGHIADNVRPREMKAQDVTAAAIRWLKRTRAFVQFRMAPTNQGGADTMPAVHRRDWSQPGSAGAGDAHLLLTSPPYADAIDYTLAQRLSLYLLGYDDAAIRDLVAGEIGARRKRSKSTSRVKWSEQLCGAISDQLSWLRPEAFICLVLPHKESGRREGEDDLKASLERLGWRLFFERDRSIHQSHTRQSWTSIKRETILVFNPG